MELLVLDTLLWRTKMPTSYTFLHLFAQALPFCTYNTVCLASYLLVSAGMRKLSRPGRSGCPAAAAGAIRRSRGAAHSSSSEPAARAGPALARAGTPPPEATPIAA
jgi:hypothetical protein